MSQKDGLLSMKVGIKTSHRIIQGQCLQASQRNSHWNAQEKKMKSPTTVNSYMHQGRRGAIASQFDDTKTIDTESEALKSNKNMNSTSACSN